MPPKVPVTFTNAVHSRIDCVEKSVFVADVILVAIVLNNYAVFPITVTEALTPVALRSSRRTSLVTATPSL